MYSRVGKNFQSSIINLIEICPTLMYSTWSDWKSSWVLYFEECISRKDYKYRYDGKVSKISQTAGLDLFGFQV